MTQKEYQKKIDEKVDEFIKYFRTNIENEVLTTEKSIEYENKKKEHHQFIDDMRKAYPQHNRL